MGVLVPGLYLQPRVATQGAKDDAQGEGHVLQPHRRLRIAPFAGPGDEAMPEGADLFFHLVRPSTKGRSRGFRIGWRLAGAR